MTEIELPLGLGMALAQNEAAMKRFESLSEPGKAGVCAENAQRGFQGRNESAGQQPDRRHRSDKGSNRGCGKPFWFSRHPVLCFFQDNARKWAIKCSLFSRAVVVGRPRFSRAPIAHLTSIRHSPVRAFAALISRSSASGVSTQTA